MPKRMLIDASHPEETRVVVLDGNRVEEFDFEAASKRPLKGNIYLAKVTRVEPSLQAAFVEYGGNRQGFLAFSEIHPDYYQIPVADRIALLEAQTQRMLAEDEFDAVDMTPSRAQEPMLDSQDGDEHAQAEGENGQQAHEYASQEEGERTSKEEESSEDNGPVQGTSSSADNRDEDEDEEEEEEEEREEDEGGLHPEAQAHAHDESGADVEHSDAADQPASVEQANPETAEGQPQQEPGEPASHEPSTVQAEATGAPESYRRRGPRQNDRHRDVPRPPRRRQYKIQEVIKRRQIMLVQVVKEERGNKGASLTTFLSLAGRYCVLMPNTPRGGGISRKITNLADRKRLKSAAQSLELPEGMGLIIRTAGANRTKLEIKRDYEYLLRLWDTVRELTLKSNAPALVYEEGSLIKRVIRDLYSKDISEIVVDGDAGYRDAKDFMRMLMPSHAKNVKPYKEPLPLFQSHHVEAQLDAMFSPVVQLKSGGYIVINQTEALVAIDVNSGKATREHSIEETAHKTNLEAADEVGRQLRLRDLAGLIVLDFIDMEDSKNDRNVEKRLHNAVRGDRARIQIGKISQFGLLEMSRQRLRAGVLAGSTVTCPHCNGQGLIRSTESAALRLLRSLDEEGQKQPAANVTVRAPSDVTIYTLNQKRRELARIEEAYDLAISFDPQQNMMGGSFEIERTGVRVPTPRPKAIPVSIEAGFEDREPEEPETDVTIVEAPVETAPRAEGASVERSDGANGNGNGEGRGRKRRRRRRGGRGRGPQSLQGHESETHQSEPGQGDGETAPAIAGADMTSEGEDSDEGPEGAGEESGAEHTHSGPAPAHASEGGEGRRRRRRRGRRGRRGPGENGAASNEARTQGPQEHATAFGEPIPETHVIAPNADSSPLWSLSDSSPQPASAPVSEIRETRRPVMVEAEASGAEVGKAAPSSQTQAEVSQTSTPAKEESPASEEGAPDSRKGWWQRRFKM
jgi:ribonuclease E